MLTITHYTKTYPGGRTAVDDLTLHVSPGEICGFIGHNGAGKTTTLRAVAGGGSKPFSERLQVCLRQTLR